MAFEGSTFRRDTSSNEQVHVARERPPQKPYQHPTVWIQELTNAVEGEIGEAMGDARLLQRSEAFGISAAEYKAELEEKLEERKRNLAAYAAELKLNLNQPAHRIQDEGRLRHLLERITGVQEMTRSTLDQLHAPEETRRVLPKDTDAPSSPWAAYRQETVKKSDTDLKRNPPNIPANYSYPQNNAPVAPDGSFSQGFTPNQVNWSQYQQPAAQPTSLLGKAWAARPKFLKRWF